MKLIAYLPLDDCRAHRDAPLQLDVFFYRNL